MRRKILHFALLIIGLTSTGYANITFQINRNTVQKRKSIYAQEKILGEILSNSHLFCRKNKDPFFKCNQYIMDKIKLTEDISGYLVLDISGVDVQEQKLMLATVKKNRVISVIQVAEETLFADGEIKASSEMEHNIIMFKWTHKSILDQDESGKITYETKQKLKKYQLFSTGEITLNSGEDLPPEVNYRYLFNKKNLKEKIMPLPTLYFLGWGKKKYFAYIQAYEEDGKGAFIYEWVVQNMVNDKILWSKKDEYLIEEEKRIKGIKAGAQNFFPVYFQEKIEQYRPILQRYFLREGDWQLSPLPLDQGRDKYDVGIKVAKGPSEIFGEPEIKNYKVTVIKNSKVNKVIAEKKINSPGMYYLFPLGAVENVDKKRIAVLMVKITRGWEGPPHDVRLSFLGCLLTKGFK